ncbi:MAG: sigma-70 family RNA polymerase sigma factor [Anaerolineales bacterium]|nr:MAG: sigma-70 family RNA polymerase sigma factor [Anaerolineales bacterium]
MPALQLVSKEPTLDETVDRELILQLQSGELEALGVLYDRHRQLVFRTAVAITGDAEMASDLLQEVFLRLHRFAQRVDPERPIQPWLYRMTTNLSYTWVKRRTRWLRFIQDMADRVILDKRPSPHLLAERDEGLRWIQQAITSLPIQQRIVVVLYYINDLSLQEIGEILEIPVGTVKSRLYYARRVLKNKLGIHREALLKVYYETT